MVPVKGVAQGQSPLSRAAEYRKRVPTLEESCKNLLESKGMLIQFRSASEMPEALSSNFDSEKEVSDFLSKLIPESRLTVKRTLSGLSPEACFYSQNAALLEREETKLGLHRIYTVTFADLEAKQGMPAKCRLIQERLAQLKAHPFVKHAEINQIVKLQTNDSFLGSSGSWGQGYQDLWGLDVINARAAWSRSEGADVVVAVVDSGIDYNHPDLWDNIWVSPLLPDRNGDGRRTLDDIDLNSNRRIEPNELTAGAIGFNAVREEGSAIDPIDLNGHGTHVAGTIAAVGGNFIGMSGVAPRAKILTIKSFGSSGAASFEDIFNGFREALRYGAKISNHSYGGPGNSEILTNIFELAYRLDNVAVVAAGNSSSDSAGFSPANLETVITVAACSPTFRKPEFSNYGDRVTLCAPGGGDDEEDALAQNNILSTMLYSNTLATDFPALRVRSEGTSNSGYVRLAGTSMASPHVAGGAALLAALNPNLTPEEIRSALQFTSRKTINSEFSVGGMLDVGALVTLTSPLPVARILQKDNSSYKKGEVMNIVGSAFGSQFASYRLDYGFGTKPTNWINLTSSRTPVINGNLLSRFDSRIALDEEVTVRLQVFDRFGRFAEDYLTLSIPDFKIKSPYSYDTFNTSERLEIRVRMRNPTIVNYTVEIAESSQVGIPSAWTQRGITSLNSLIREPDVLLGYLDPKVLSADKFYTLRVSTVTNLGRRKEFFVRHIFAGSALKKGFPLSLDFEGKPEGVEEENALGNYQFQYATVTDLDNDGKKEIVTISPGLTLFEAEVFTTPTLKVFTGDGKLKWKRRFGDRNTVSDFDFKSRDIVPTIGDIDGDGRKEIFFYPYQLKNGAGVIEAFTHDGKNLAGWPLTLPARIGKPDVAMAMADLDGDGKDELLLHLFFLEPNVVEKVRVLIINKDKTLTFSDTSSGSCALPNQLSASLITVGEFHPLPGKEVIFRGGCNELVAIRADGKLLPNWPKTYGRGQIQSPMAVDIQGDGLDEILFLQAFSTGFEFDYTPFPVFLNVLDSAGNLLPGWPHRFNSNLGAMDTQLSAADLDGDGRKEIVFTSDYGTEELISVMRADGNYFPGWPRKIVEGINDSISSLERSVLGTVIADINNDTKLDIILSLGGIAFDGPFNERFSESSGGVFAFSSDGSRIDLNPNPKIFALVMGGDSSRGSLNPFPPVISDLDNDGFLDILSTNILESSYSENGAFTLSEERSGLYAFSTKGRVGRGRVAWPQLYGNEGLSNRSIVDKSLNIDPTPTPTATPTPNPYSAANLTKLLNSLYSLADKAKAPPITKSDREVFLDIKKESRIIDDYLARHSLRLPRVGRENFRDVWRRARTDLELMDSVKDRRDGDFFRTNLVFLAAKRRALADILILVRSLR
jgi:subtilisin family serine protease